MNLRYTTILPEYMKSLTKLNMANTAQLEFLYTHGCQHRHRYIRHFNCFLNDFNVGEKIGFLDIETSNLKANFGIVLCWCILDTNGKITEDFMSVADIRSGIEDKAVVEHAVAAMRQYDRIVTHYGTYFDIPFLRTRALIHHLDFPKTGELWHTDTWKMAKRTLCLHSNRQDVIAESLYGKTTKTRISHPDWRKAMLGNEKSMMEVLDHCEKDVMDLRKNYYTLLPYCKVVRSSI